MPKEMPGLTASCGSGGVTIGTSTVGTVAVTGLSAVPALTPRIHFDLSWTLGHLFPRLG